MFYNKSRDGGGIYIIAERAAAFRASVRRLIKETRDPRNSHRSRRYISLGARAEHPLGTRETKVRERLSANIQVEREIPKAAT